MLGKIKLKIFIAALVALILAILNTTYIAYYIPYHASSDIVTSGDVCFVIHQRSDQGTEFPREGFYIVPGDVISKEVTIESLCDRAFYLRVKIVYGIDSTELSVDDCFKLNINEEQWEYYDGWYYYKGIVNPYETTPHIYSHVEMIGSSIDNSYIGRVLTLSIIAHAVQSENNPIIDGHVYTASGWLKE